MLIWLCLSAMGLGAVGACSGGSSVGGTATDTALQGRVEDGKPQGMFFMTRFWIATGSLEKSCYYFTADGRAYKDPTGLLPAELEALPPTQRGTFEADGKQMTITWADNQKSSGSMEDVHDAAFNWDAGIFVGMKPFASADDLVGTFEGGNSVSFSGNSTIASNTYNFKPDGEYSREGAVTSSVSTSESTAHLGGTSAGDGHWQLKGWQLSLTDAKGHTAQGVAFPFDADEKTGRVTRFYYQGVAYKRL